jgi:hypothetical protein
MVGGVRDGLPIEDATPRSLWARLIAGQVTQVCLLGPESWVYDYLPRTLGLDVVPADAYVYGRYGVLRPHSERAEIARALAAEPRWLAIGGLPYWVEPFARRAEAILIPETKGPDPTRRSVSMFFRKVPRALFELHDEQEWEALEADPVFAASAYIFDALANWELRSVKDTLMRDFLLRGFPAKTFMVSSQRLAELRAIRAK